MRVVLFTSVIAACSAVAVYNPPNAGVALDAIEQALTKIVNSPHLTKTQLAQAKKVSTDVEKTVAELETAEGQKLSKEARGAKVAASIKELQDLQESWSKAADQKLADRKADLQKQLEAKEAELAKDKKMMKVLNLEKALAEKKLKLQELIDAKNNKAAQAEAQKKAAEEQEMVAKVLNVAKALKDSKPSEAKPVAADKLKTVMTYLEGREHDVSEKLAKLDADQKKQEAQLKEAEGDAKKAPVKDAKDPLAKSDGILKMLMKKERRQYAKAKATLHSEKKELDEAITSIKNGDVTGLTKVMSHMQGEMKSLEAKTHKFLY